MLTAIRQGSAPKRDQAGADSDVGLIADLERSLGPQLCILRNEIGRPQRGRYGQALALATASLHVPSRTSSQSWKCWTRDSSSLSHALVNPRELMPACIAGR